MLTAGIAVVAQVVVERKAGAAADFVAGEIVVMAIVSVAILAVVVAAEVVTDAGAVFADTFAGNGAVAAGLLLVASVCVSTYQNYIFCVHRFHITQPTAHNSVQIVKI